MESILQYFDEEDISKIEAHGNGHINHTFLVELKNGERFILQKINKHVFKCPEKVMDNIRNITSFLSEKISREGGNPERKTLTIIQAKNGNDYVLDEENEYWRVYRFVPDAICYEKAENPELFYKVGKAFGNFQKLLIDFPGESLYEVIKDFHNTQKRYEKFLEVLQTDIRSRAKEVSQEIEFILKRKEYANFFVEKINAGSLPIRVTHNDTKINNIMMDKVTGEGGCVIDLDTVMPGLLAYDFGDAIRSGANKSQESEQNLNKVGIDLEMYEAFTKGFLESLEGELTELEVECLSMGAKVMTYEQAIRYLTDYLEGDIYFKTHYEGQNLMRCRNQLRLLEDIERNWEQMCQIVEKYK